MPLKVVPPSLDISMDKTARLFEALKCYGLAETAGPLSSPEIMAMAKELEADYHGDETSWCGLAMAAWEKRAGGKPPAAFLSARSWLGWGEPVEKPGIGDVCVLWREDPNSWKGHVGMFIAERGGLLYLLGGNQGNTVTIASYHANRLLGYRRG